MIKNKLKAASPLLLILLLSAVIILVIMIVKGGTLDQIKKGQEIKEGVKVDLQQVETSTDKYNQIIQEALNEK
ncbi:MAG: hypothetical protein WCJ57_02985 [Candidatus Falkowbacteria bacterium]